MGLKDKLMEGMDKAKGAVQSGMEKVQEKHAENQRIKQLPCIVCGKPVGGGLMREAVKGEDNYICLDCRVALPFVMRRSDHYKEFEVEDFRIGYDYAQLHPDPEKWTAQDTGFHVTDYLGSLWLDENKLRFAIGKDLGRMPKDEDISPDMQVYSFAWLENFYLHLYDVSTQDNLRSGSVYFDVSIGFLCSTPYPVPDGLSIEPEPKMAKLTAPSNNTIKSHLKHTILDETWADMIKGRVRYTDPPEVIEIRQKILALAMKAGAIDAGVHILHNK